MTLVLPGKLTTNIDVDSSRITFNMTDFAGVIMPNESIV